MNILQNFSSLYVGINPQLSSQELSDIIGQPLFVLSSSHTIVEINNLDQTGITSYNTDVGTISFLIDPIKYNLVHILSPNSVFGELSLAKMYYILYNQIPSMATITLNIPEYMFDELVAINSSLIHKDLMYNTQTCIQIVDNQLVTANKPSQ